RTWRRWAAAVGPGEPLARQPRCGCLVHDGHYPHPATRGLASDVRPSRGLQARAERLLLSKPCSRRTPSPMTPSAFAGHTYLERCLWRMAALCRPKKAGRTGPPRALATERYWLPNGSCGTFAVEKM